MASTVRNFLIVCLLFISQQAYAATFPVAQTDPFTYTVASTSWALSGTSITVQTGLTISAGQAVFDNNQSANGAAAFVGIVSAYNSGTGVLTISAAKVASAGSTDALGIGNVQGPGCSNMFYRNAYCKSINVAGTYRPVGPGAHSTGIYYLTDAGVLLGGPPFATGSWSVGSTTITTQTGLSIQNGMIVSDNSTGKLAGFVSTYNNGTGVITLQAGAYNAGSLNDGLTLKNPFVAEYSKIAAGDMPDPDPTDPTIATKAQFETKWCGGVSPCSNANMRTFVQTQKGLTSAQTARVYYLSQSGNDGTGAVNNPSLPYRSFAPILTALSDKQGGIVVIRGGNWTGASVQGFISGTTLVVTSLSSYYVEVGQSVTGTGVTGGTTITAALNGDGAVAGEYTVNNSQSVGSPVSTAATASWTGAATTITVPASLAISAGMVVFDPIAATASGNYGAVICTVQSYSGTTLTCTGTVSSASASGIDPLLIGTPEALTTGNPPGLDLGPCSTGNPCYVLSGTRGLPVYVMAYPGEAVTSDLYTEMDTYGPYPYQCCVNFDSINMRAYTFVGNVMQSVELTAGKLLNDEFIGADKVFFGNNSNNITIENSVYHEGYNHSFYFGDNTPTGTPNFDFAINALGCNRGDVNTPGPKQMCATAYAYINNDSFYSNGETGFEPIHLNTYLKGVVLENNIVSYSGGAGLTLQTGVQDATIKNNVFFDNAASGLTLNLYGIVCTQPGSIKNVDYENNIVYKGLTTDSIRGAGVGSGFVASNGSGPALGTPCPGTSISNYRVINNVMLVDTDNLSTFHFIFNIGSNPLTAKLLNNYLWSTNGSPNGSTDLVGAIWNGADSMPTTACTTTLSSGGLTGHACTLSQFQSLNSGNLASGNTYADPKFENASTSFTTTPWQFNFLFQPTSPACSIAGPTWAWKGC